MIFNLFNENSHYRNGHFMKIAKIVYGGYGEMAQKVIEGVQ